LNVTANLVVFPFSTPSTVNIPDDAKTAFSIVPLPAVLRFNFETGASTPSKQRVAPEATEIGPTLAKGALS
jgi:hypothetical protein